MNFSNNMVSPLEIIPSDYVAAAVLAHEVGKEMMARLAFMSLQPRRILDAASGAGEMSASLKARYKQAQVLAFDADFSLLQYAKEAQSPSYFLCAKPEQLPLADHSVDLIFANLLLPFHHDIKLLLKEWRRILSPDGLLMLTTLGPDTWREWPQTLRQAGPALIDMHDIGDLLLAEGLADPVLDVDYYTLSYRNKDKLMKELYQSKMLKLPIALENLEETPTSDGAWEMTYEVIHAHAFAPPLQNEVSASEDGVARISLAHLRRQLKSY